MAVMEARQCVATEEQMWCVPAALIEQSDISEAATVLSQQRPAFVSSCSVSQTRKFLTVAVYCTSSFVVKRSSV